MTAKEIFDIWYRHDGLEPSVRAELERIKDDPSAIEDCFGTELAFGTAGLRGVLGAGPGRMNVYTVSRASAGYAAYIASKGADARRRGVVIAHDNRRMSREFALTTAGVFAAHGVHAWLFASLRPTPELSFAVRYLGAAGGVMITASHNPPEYNGYKIYNSEGCQCGLDETARVIDCISEVGDPLDIPSLGIDEAAGLIGILDGSIDEEYYRAVESISLRRVDAGDLRVVYSPQHGTGNVPVRRVLADLGYDVVPVEAQCTPDPDFSATKSPNPESPLAYEAALELADKVNADIVITTDPDCDRLGVAARGGDGKLKLMTGNQSGAVLIEYILSAHRSMGTMPEKPVMVNTIVTSDLGDRICESYGVKVEKTLTGFKFIGERIARHLAAHDANYVFGYEESYGCLIGTFVRDKDATQASLMLCEAAAYYKAQGKTLIDVLNGLYARFGFYLDTQSNFFFRGADGQKKIAALTAGLRREHPAEVAGARLVRLEDYLSDETQAEGFPKSDVLRFVFSDGCWVAVRPSGTEPKCKFYYCVRAAGEAEASEKLAALKEAFEPKELANRRQAAHISGECFIKVRHSPFSS